VKCIFIGYSVDVKGYNLWDLISRIFLYKRKVDFREVKYSPILVQLEEDWKKLLVQQPPKTEKDEHENEYEVHDGPDEEECLESLEEEE